jgi:DhnA family fructose-bisphosphate aldolase class Ia
MARIFARTPVIIVPLDDGLISGPLGGLADVGGLLRPELLVNIDAILGFRGLLCALECQLRTTPFIINVSGSTTRSQHTKKRIITSINSALRLGADAIAFHLNVSDASEGHMLKTLGHVIDEAEAAGVPVFVIAYPRREGPDGDDNYREMRIARPSEFVELVTHSVRIAVEMGASAVKTVYTGTPESFHEVVRAACGIPLIVAGGPPISDDAALEKAVGGISAGAVGIAFGRQVFMHHSPAAFLQRLRAAVDDLSN